MSRKPVPQELRDATDDDYEDQQFPGTSTSASKQNIHTDPRADSIVAEAEKKLKSFSLFGGGTKYEDAVEKLVKAANMYKINKNWEAAGDTYARAGEICEKNIKDENEASTNYVNAAKAYKNSNASKAMKYFQISTNMLMEHNRFSSAAKLWKEVAELYEKDLQYRYASEAYEKAATCYEAEDSKANASACKIKVAQLAAELEDYKKSIEIYEQVSRQALDTNVGRWSVTKYLFAALLCQFALSAKKGDLSRLENKLEKYRDMHPQLDGTREARLIENCIQAFNEDDVDKYTDEVMRYDEILKLDNWTAKILLDIKTSLQEGAEGEKDAGDVSDLQ